jgi:hypothetical protein
VGFDIEKLLDFEPASGRCVKCLALVPSIKVSEDTYSCPTCDIRAVRSNIFSATGSGLVIGSTLTPVTVWDSTFQAYGYGYPTSSTYNPQSFLLPVAFNKDAMEHAKELAGFARLLRSVGVQPPLRILVACLLRARAFVHFTTFGISQAMLGALAAVSEQVQVAGIASNVDGNTQKEIEQLCDDFPQLDICSIPRSDSGTDMIHSKLIVIDGLLALSGSANLTTGAWRKAAANKERLDIVTDVQRVIEDNNRYFASHWAELHREFDLSPYPSQGWQVYQSDKNNTGE